MGGGNSGEMRGSLRTRVTDAGVKVRVAAAGTSSRVTTQLEEVVTVTVVAEGPTIRMEEASGAEIVSVRPAGAYTATSDATSASKVNVVAMVPEMDTYDAASVVVVIVWALGASNLSEGV